MPHKHTNANLFVEQQKRGLWREHPLDSNCQQFMALEDILDAIPHDINMDDCVIRYDDQGLSLYSPQNAKLWKKELNVQRKNRPTRDTE